MITPRDERFFNLDRLVAHGRALRDVAGQNTPALRLVNGLAPPPGCRLGLLAGSFNPPTVAHQTLALAGLTVGGIDRVWNALSTRTVDKEIVSGAALEDRLLLLDLLVEPDRRLGTAIMNRGLYVDQAQIVAEAFPTLGEIVFLVGHDKIVQIFDPRYYDDRDAALEALFARAGFLVAPRGDDGPEALAALLNRPENRRFAGAVRPLDLASDLRDVASSTIRQHLESGGDLDLAVPPLVADFIAATGVYVDEERYRQRCAIVADALQPDADPAEARARLLALGE